MARMKWGDPFDVRYKQGVDRGILYVGDKIVPWNGIVSVEEKSVGGALTPVYLEGRRIRNISGTSEFDFTLRAFYSPEEFDACDGILQTSYPGIYADGQTRQSFHLSYRTSYVDSLGNRQYKIHIVYNATAEPSSRTNSTIGDSTMLDTLSWDIKTHKTYDSRLPASSHYIIDTGKVDVHILSILEEFIYGSSETDPKLLSVDNMEYAYRKAWSLRIVNMGYHYTVESSTHALSINDDVPNIRTPKVQEKAGYYEMIGD